MSTEAMAVVIGVVCGVAAGIPTSILLLLVLNRRDRQQVRGEEQQRQQGNYPPVVVIQGGGYPQGLPPASAAGYWPSSTPGPTMERQFHVVGGDDLIVDGREW
jgi:MFS superfamily sulfate permease-like transporter